MTEAIMQKVLYTALKELREGTEGNRMGLHRMSISDLATDLAPLVLKHMPKPKSMGLVHNEEGGPDFNAYWPGVEDR